MNKTVDFFDRRCDMYPDGEGWECSAWPSQEYQIRLFKAASMVGDLRTGSVLDVGCGLADLYAYLNKPSDYVGIDISSKMISRAKLRYPEASLRCISLDDYDGSHDWVIAIGTFNTVVGSGDEQLRQLENSILKMLSIAKRGVSLSFLSRRAVPADMRYKELFYYDPVDVARICLALNRRVAVDHMSDVAQCHVLMRV